MPHPFRNPEVLAHLYLEAVLPTLAELPSLSAEARELIQGWNRSIAFGIIGEPLTCLTFSDQTIRVETNAPNAEVTLRLFGSIQVVRLFEERGFVIPIPTSGWKHLGEMRRFTALTKIMKPLLEPKEVLSEEKLRAHVQLVLALSAKAVPILAKYDDVSQHHLARTPTGLLHLRIPDAEASAWIEWNGKTVLGGRGTPPREPDTTLTFSTLEIAQKAFAQNLDELIAIGNGSLGLHGLVPLADGLNLVMNRTSFYLQPSSS